MITALMAQRRTARNLDALNRHDLATYLEGWGDDVVLVYPGTIPGISGTHSGKTAVRAFFQRVFQQFPSMRFTIRHVMVQHRFGLRANNVLAVHWDLHVVNRHGLDARTSGVSVVTLRRGKVVLLEDYLFDTGERFQAAWAGDEAVVHEELAQSPAR